MKNISLIIEVYKFKLTCLFWLFMVGMLLLTKPAILLWTIIHPESSTNFLEGIEYLLEEKEKEFDLESKRLKQLIEAVE